ncbi:non-specific lipid transfer protein GPI-anchored 26-like [Curcuma longa]|uniref:non-specific lipid transfer protein GPI-anchored 26-like n=1 Tax=Curcuma longa TaxID=136217 RepID=UPI003D9E9579
MDRNQGVVVLVFIIMTTLVGIASAQSSGCTSAIISLAPCLNYITGNASTPSSSCCSQLASIVRSQPACLCSVLNGGASSFGVTVDRTRALAMPGACKVQTPPVSQCNNGAKSPTPSPETRATPEAPADPTLETPSVTSPPTTEDGSRTTPATQATASGAAAVRSPATLMLSSFFLAACITFTKLI